MSIVLLVHPNAEAWLSSRPDIAATVTPAATARDARAYLAGTAFDAVYLGPDVEGGEAITALRDVLGLSTPIHALPALDDLPDRLSGATGATPPGDSQAALDEVAGELSRVAHALNNPLAVISGNAQLGLEMARATAADEMVVEALQSIAEAATRLEGLFSDVAALRARIDRARDSA